jgi:hypothetical protein
MRRRLPDRMRPATSQWRESRRVSRFSTAATTTAGRLPRRNVASKLNELGGFSALTQVDSE